jgi:hypothetical protein
MVIGELYHLWLKDDLPAVVKGDPEAPGKIPANKGFAAKYANDGSTYPCVSKLGNFHPAKVCGGKHICYLIRKGESQIAIRGFAIGQKAFGEDDIAIKTGIQKRLNGFTPLVDYNGQGNIRKTSAGK